MPEINLNGDKATIIVYFDTNQDSYQNLLEAIYNAMEVIKTQPGFISFSVHQSLDKSKIVNYSQWQTSQDFFNFLGNPELQKEVEAVRNFNPNCSVYEVVNVMQA